MAEIETEAQKKYWQDGFYVSPQAVVPAAVVKRAAAGAEEVKLGRFLTGVAPQNEFSYDPAALCKINNAHMADTALYELVTHPDLGRWIARGVGAEWVQVFATQLLVKPAVDGDGGNVGWHQDRQYWGYWEGEDGLLTAWIALRDVGPASGPLCFVAGSHRWGFLAAGDFFSTDQKQLRQTIKVPKGQSWREVSAPMAAGGASLHHCLTFHGSGPNTSGVPRLSIAVHMRTEAARPVAGATDYWVSHLDEAEYCPVIYGG